jgi:ketopantoate hydroxymethyltransferase
MQNPLELLPPKVRAVVYAVLGLAAIGVGAWQASDGDILVAVALGLGALGFGTALSNTPVKE